MSLRGMDLTGDAACRETASGSLSFALRRLALAGAATLCVLLGGLAFGSVAAFATLTYPFDGQLPQSGALGDLEVGSVAVDDVNGDTYVADSTERTGGLVDVFSAAGTQLAGLDGSLTPAGSFGEKETSGSVAVAADDASGRVYVLDSVHGVVDVFDSANEYVCQITGSASPSASECNGAAGSATPAGGISEPGGLAVDTGGIAVDQATGRVYVVDAYNGVVDVFSAAGAYVSQILLGSIPGGFIAFYMHGIAVDDFNGHVFVSESGPVLSLYEFNAAGEYLTTWTGSNTPQGSFGDGVLSVAADNATGDVFVSETKDRIIDVFTSSGEYLRQLGHAFRNPEGTAVDQGSGRVYVSDTENGVPDVGVVDVFDPLAVLPDVTTGPAVGVAATGATLEGSVNPDAVQLSDCRFDYGTSSEYGQVAPCVPAAGSIPADSSVHAVTAGLSGLTPGVTYHFRLEASNANCAHCTTLGEDATFATPPRPSIDVVTSTGVASSSADLNARIDPNGFDTIYRFEYGTSTAYGTSVPVPDGDIGAGTSAVPVTAHVSGLSANTTYHWRVVASSVNGITVTGDQTFVYDTSGGGLPDNRAYEMVTPAQKNSGLIDELEFGIVPAVSEAGTRVMASTVQCFGEAVSCVADRGPVGTPYTFTRTRGAWVASALAPPTTQLDVNTALAVNVDADTALFTAPTPPGEEDDLYARGSDGSFSDIGPVTPPARGALGPSAETVYETTADLSRVVFRERASRWPFDVTTSGHSTVYEYAGLGNSQPFLVDVSGGAGSTSLIGVCGTYLGGSDDFQNDTGVLSADGRTVFFTPQACASGSGVNAGVPVPAQELYARVDESRTVLLSGRSPAGCTSAACLGSPEGDAAFEGASVDGSKVFFESTQQLTDSASEDLANSASAGCHVAAGANGCNLYEYDFANPAGHELLAVSAGDSSGGGPRVQGVLAVSGDGSHVYFVAKGVLTGVANGQGQTAQDGAENLYVFERDAAYPSGRVAFIAALPVADESEEWVQGGGNGGRVANVTPDGRFLVFMSRGRLTADDSSTTGARQVFRYDAQTGELVRISVGEQGFNDNGNAGVGDAGIARVHPTHLGPLRRDPTMSHDGSFVFFESPVALTPHALDDVFLGINGAGAKKYAENVYEYHEGHVYLLSDGRDVSKVSSLFCETSSSVCLLGTDATGANVFFMTADPLVAQDVDTQKDIYDARICTAGEPCIAAPAPAPAPACQGEGCHGTPSAAPPAPGAATSVFAGPGNLPAPPAAVVHRKAVVKKRAKHRPRRKTGRGKRRGAARTGKHVKRGRK